MKHSAKKNDIYYTGVWRNVWWVLTKGGIRDMTLLCRGVISDSMKINGGMHINKQQIANRSTVSLKYLILSQEAGDTAQEAV